MFSLRLFSQPGFSSANADRILIIAPHPDDESLACAGVIKRAVNNCDKVKIIIIFDGAAYGNARARRKETIKAMKLLGVPPRDITFLGFPDGKGLAMWQSRNTVFAGEKYHFALEPRTAFNWPMLVSDLKKVLLSCNPTRIYSPSEHDEHGDHQATAKAVKIALSEPGCLLHGKELYSYLIHWENHSNTWPGDDVSWSLTLQKSGVKSPTHAIGNTPAEVLLPDGFTPDHKRHVINKYSSQLGGKDLVLAKFAKSSEIFWPECIER
ncbi:MAG TPA: PIG-L family deacetylase [Gammaproteobacteria bacterium]|nr:PIG-L family deacetylase [Gammaproteobacteria bacterium]